jgi:hypothetical protein
LEANVSLAKHINLISPQLAEEFRFSILFLIGLTDTTLKRGMMCLFPAIASRGTLRLSSLRAEMEATGEALWTSEGEIFGMTSRYAGAATVGQLRKRGL